MKGHFFSKPIPFKYLLFAAIVLLIPALFINLGKMPMIGDESIRALVAFEMLLSGDWITPTIAGGLYFNKPPLYNWVLTLSMWLSGSTAEFWVRFPNQIFLMVFAAVIFLFTRRQLGNKLALINGLAIITCGRILVWDANYALIDISFSLLVYLSFMLMFHFFNKQKYSYLFILTYIIASATFLMKGIPAIAFQAISLLVLFIWGKQLKKLFLPSHFLAMGIFVFLVGSYYFLFNLKNPGVLPEIVKTLIYESTHKTGVKMGFWPTFGHLFTFPFELFYHFLPWTLPLFLLLFKKTFINTFKNSFIKYNAIIFFANIIIYWLSPEAFPRYLFMMMPLVFTIGFYAYSESDKNIVKQILDYLPLIASFIAIGLLLYVPFFLNEKGILNMALLSLLFIALFIFIIYLWKKQTTNRIILLAFFLLSFKIAYNLFVIPSRAENTANTTVKTESIRIANQYEGQQFFVAANIPTISMYYFSSARHSLLKLSSKEVSDGIVVVTQKREAPDGAVLKDSISFRYYPNKAYIFEVHSRLK